MEINLYRVFVLLVVLLLASCVTVSSENTPTDAPILFVTSTLPPTKQGLTVPTPIPPTATATLDPSAPTPTPSCRDSAAFVEDVTIPDNTNFEKGESFTKTWKLQNSGTCDWKNYTVAFHSGERMNAPDSVAVPDTAAKSDVEISVDLVAPSVDGQYLGSFELRNENGETVPIGIENTFWVKIVVGESSLLVGTTNCYYTTNAEYVQQLIDRINQARADEGLAALTVNPQLTAAAQGHSLDMACNDFFKQRGSDGLWTGKRLQNAGYTSAYYVELIAFGLPGDAMNQWKLDPLQWDNVLNSRVTEIGVGYVFVRTSSLGGYWTVVMGRP